MKQKLKKWLAGMLSVLMMVSAVPVNATSVVDIDPNSFSQGSEITVDPDAIISNQNSEVTVSTQEHPENESESSEEQLAPISLGDTDVTIEQDMIVVESPDEFDSSNPKKGVSRKTKDSPLLVDKGSIIRFFLTIKNTNEETNAESVKVTDVIPEGLTYVIDSAYSYTKGQEKTYTREQKGKYDEASKTLTWDLGTIKASAPDATTEIILSFEATAPAEKTTKIYTNKASIEYEDPDTPDPKKKGESNEVAVKIYPEPEISIEIAQRNKTKETMSFSKEEIGEPLHVNGKDVIEYKITVKNTGDGKATNITVTDLINQKLVVNQESLTKSYGSYAKDNHTITWTIKKLEAQTGQEEITFEVTVPSDESTAYNNTAKVTKYTNELKPESEITGGIESNTVSVTTDPSPKISIEIEQKKAKDALRILRSIPEALQVAKDDVIEYKISVKNKSSGKATNIKITAKIPEGLVLVPESISDEGSELDGTITWDISEMTGNKTESRTFKVTVPEVIETSDWTVTTSATYTDHNKPEEAAIAQAIVNASVILEIQQRITNAEAENAFTKETSDSPLKSHGLAEIEYKIIVRNAGDGKATNIKVTDTLPEGLTYVGESANESGEELEGTITWNISEMAPNEQKELTFKAKIPSETDAKTYTNKATATYTNPDEEEETKNSDASNEVCVATDASPSISIKKEQKVDGAFTSETKDAPLDVQIGDAIEYKITVTNSSEGKAYNVVVTDKIPEGLVLVSDSITESGNEEEGTITWNFEELEGTKELTYKVTVPNITKTTTWKNSATINYKDPNKEGTQETTTTPVAVKLTTAPDMSIVLYQRIKGTQDWTQDLSASALSVERDNVIEYKIVVTNNGTGVASEINVTDKVPTGLKYREGSATVVDKEDKGSHLKGTDTVEFTVDELAPNESATFTFEVDVPTVDKDTVWENSAALTYKDQQLPEAPQAQKTSNTVASKTTARIDLTIEKKQATMQDTQILAGGEQGQKEDVTVVKGNTIRYFITVKNNSNVNVENVKVIDIIPDGVPETLLEYVKTEPNVSPDGRTITWDVGELAPEEERTFTVDLTVPTILADTTWENTATLSYTDPTSESNPTTKVSNAVTAKAYPDYNGKITIEKSQVAFASSSVPGEFTKELLYVNGEDTVRYQIVVKNDSDAPVKQVIIKDVLPEGLIHVTQSEGGSYEDDTRTVTWNPIDIAAHSSATVTVDVTVPQMDRDTSWTNSATATYQNNDPQVEGNPRPEIKSNDVQITQIPPRSATLEKFQVQVVKGQESGERTKDDLLLADKDVLRYVLVFKNTGKGVLDGVVIKDTIPTGELENLTLVNDSITENGAIEAGNEITWKIDEVAVGETVTVIFDVTIPKTDDYTEWTNSAKATFNAHIDPQNPSAEIKNPDIVSNSVKVKEDPKATVSITKTQSIVTNDRTNPVSSDITAEINNTIRYFITITNTSDTSAKNVSVRDSVPDGLIFVAVNDGGEEHDGNLSWDIGKIPVGESRTVSFDVKVPIVATHTEWTNTAYVTHRDLPKDPDQPDKTPEMESNTVKLATNEVTLTISKEQSILENGVVTQRKATELDVIPGNVIRYFITVTNTSKATAHNVRIEDTIPAGLTFKSASTPGMYYSNGVVWADLEIGAGTTKTVYFDVEVDMVDKTTTYTNNAKVTFAEDATPDVEKVSNTVSAVTPDPSLGIYKEQAKVTNGVVGTFTTSKLDVNPNDIIEYKLTITNTSDVQASMVRVVDNIPEGLIVDPSSIGNASMPFNGGIIWVIDAIAPRTSEVITFRATVPMVDRKTSWTNTAETSNAIVSTENSNAVEIETPDPSLAIEKSQGLMPCELQDVIKTKLAVEPDNTVRYFVTVTNTSTVNASNVTVVDTIANGLTLVDDSISHEGKENDGTITWNLDVVEAGKSVTLTFDVKVPMVDKSTVWTNKASTYNDIVEEVESNTLEIETPNPKLAIDKAQWLVTEGEPVSTTDTLDVNPDDVVRYFITVTNTSPVNASNVRITDQMPDGLKFVSSDEGENIRGTISWLIPVLGPGETKVVTYDAKVPMVDRKTTYSNIARVSNAEVEEEVSNVVEIVTPDPALTIKQEQGLMVSGTATPTTETLDVVPDNVVRYFITVTNTSTVQATNVVITDAIPDRLILVAASDRGTNIDGVMTWNIDTIEPGTSKTVTLDLKVPMVGRATTWTNDAKVSNEQVVEKVTDKLSIKAPDPEVTIEKGQGIIVNGRVVETKSKLSVKPNDVVRYFITVRNTSAVNAENLIVTDKIPEGLQLVQTPSGATLRNGTLTWNVDVLGPHDTLVLTFDVKIPMVSTETSWSNTASVKSQEIREEPTNEVIIETPAPKLVVEKAQGIVRSGRVTPTQDKLTVNPDDVIRYFITVTNTGKADALDITISDILPEGLTYVGCSDAGSINNGAVTWHIDSLIYNESITVTVDVKVPMVSKATTWKNIASASNPVISYEASNSVEIVTPNPALTIDKYQSVVKNGETEPTKNNIKVNFNETVRYSITVTNTSTVTANNVVIEDKIPEGLLFLQATNSIKPTIEGNLSWTIASIGPGEDVTVTFDVKVPKVERATNWSNTAYVINPVDPSVPTPSNRVVIEDNPASLTLHNSQAILVNNSTGDRTTDKLHVEIGDTVRYFLTISNRGDGPASNVTVTDAIPEGLRMIYASNGGTATNGTITWNLGTMNIGETITLYFDIQVPDISSSSTWVNQASVTFTENPDAPIQSEKIEINAEPASVAVHATQAIVNGTNTTEKTTEKMSVTAGTTVRYFLDVVNNSNATAKNVVVTDMLPSGITFVSASNEGVEKDGIITWNLGDIAAYSTTTLIVDIQIPVVAQKTVYNNVATLTHRDNPSQLLSEELQVETEPVVLEFHEEQSYVTNGTQSDFTSNQITVNGEITIRYRLIVRNTGNIAAKNVTIVDEVPRGLQIISVYDGGINTNGTITWTTDTLAPGSSFIVSFDVKVPKTSQATSWANQATVTHEDNATPVYSESVVVAQDPSAPATPSVTPGTSTTPTQPTNPTNQSNPSDTQGTQGTTTQPGTSQTPTDAQTSQDTNKPVQTGDARMNYGFIFLGLAGIIAVGFAVFKKKKKNQN